MADIVIAVVASPAEVNGEVPGLSGSEAVFDTGGGVAVSGDSAVPVGPTPGTSGASPSLAVSSCPVVVGISQGVLAMAAKKWRSTVGSPANVRGAATSTDRLRVPGRSPSRAMESARNRWMVTAPVELAEVCASVLLRASS